MATTIEFVDLKKIEKEESDRLLASIDVWTNRIKRAYQLLFIGNLVFILYAVTFTEQELFWKWLLAIAQVLLVTVAIKNGWLD
jgi:hypothetical protein